MPTLERRIDRIEHALVRQQFQSMSDQDLLSELLTVMSDPQKAEWQALDVSEQELLATVKSVLRDWGYL
jgi:hypothetical protein